VAQIGRERGRGEAHSQALLGDAWCHCCSCSGVAAVLHGGGSGPAAWVSGKSLGGERGSKSARLGQMIWVLSECEKRNKHKRQDKIVWKFAKRMPGVPGKDTVRRSNVECILLCFSLCGCYDMQEIA
jgi:hypothetical protein